MQRLWTHPEVKFDWQGFDHVIYSGGTFGSRRTLGIRRGPIKLSSIFFLSGSSALAFATVVLILSLINSNSPTVYSSKLSDSFSPGSSTISKEQFLLSLSLEQRRQIASHTHYVSEIISQYGSTVSNPKDLALSIVIESQKANIDPLLVAAVIKSESAFKKHVRSHAGALGLMQIMPTTGEDVSKQFRVKWNGDSRLKDAQFNLKLGIAYLKQLREQFDGNLEKALIAYNWGPAKLNRAINDGRSAPTSCLRYAKTIMSNHLAWRSDFNQKRVQYQYLDVNYLQG